MDPVTIDYVVYSLSETSATITGRESPPSPWNLVIPDTITYLDVTYNVTSIDERAFSFCSDLTSVTIPSSVTTIGNNAFFFCTNLTSINIPSSVTTIGSGIFAVCSSLTNINIPSSVATIGDQIFSGCSSLTNIAFNSYINNLEDVFNNFTSNNFSLSLNYSGSIPNNAFKNLTGLKSVIIGSEITTIGAQAFRLCSGLTSINIPSSVTTIGAGAFSACTSLTSINIPNLVTNIEDSVFYGCTSLTSINIPSSVTTIETRAFSGCASFTSINIPSSVTTIGDYTFSGCSSLINIIINSYFSNLDLVFYDVNNANMSWTFDYSGNIPNNTCRYKTGLTSVTLGNQITEIGVGAFTDCSGLTSIIIPDSVTNIGGFCFSGCTSLTSVTISSSVTNIRVSTFYGCTSLTSVTIPNSVINIQDYAFQNCTSLTSINIPSSVTNLGNATFSGCASLTSEIIIPSSIPIIRQSLFQSCSSLTSVIIPNSVTQIQNFAFNSCTSLTSIIIPSSVNDIGRSAFSGCTSLTDITITNTDIYIGEYAFPYTESFIIPPQRFIDGSYNIIDIQKPLLYTTNWNYTSSDTDIADISGNTIIFITSGTVIITATLPASTFYNPFVLKYPLVISETDILPTFTYTDPQICNNIFVNTAPERDDKTVIINSEKLTPEILEVVNPLDGTDEEKLLNRNNIISNMLSTVQKDYNVIVPTDMIYLSPEIDTSNAENIKILDTDKSTENNPLVSNFQFTHLNLNEPVISTADVVFSLLDKPENTIQFNGTGENIDYSMIITKNLDNTFTVIKKYQGQITETIESAVAGDTYIYAGLNIVIGSVTAQIYIPPHFNYSFSGTDATVIGYSTPPTGDLVIPSTVTDSGITYNVTSIGDNAFQGYDSLTSITIPNSVITMSVNSFNGLQSLQNINVDLNNLNYSSIDGVLFNKDKTTLIKYPQGKSTSSYSFPSLVTTIGASSFAENSYLTNIIIPNSVKSIGDYAFGGCSSLTSITIPNSIESIGSDIFSGCSSLIVVNYNPSLNDLPSGVTWYNFNIKLNSNNSIVLDGYFVIINSTNFIKLMYSKTDLNTNILAQYKNNDYGNNHVFDRNNNKFGNGGTNITSIHALDTVYNALEWSLWLGNGISYKDLNNTWNKLPANTVTYSFTQIPRLPIIPIIPICFPAGTPVETDQGIITIEKINPEKNTIRGNKIVAITKTVTIEDNIICIEKDALGSNIPSQKTHISRNHKLLFNEEMIESKNLIGQVD